MNKGENADAVISNIIHIYKIQIIVFGIRIHVIIAVNKYGYYPLSTYEVMSVLDLEVVKYIIYILYIKGMRMRLLFASTYSKTVIRSHLHMRISD